MYLVREWMTRSAPAGEGPGQRRRREGRIDSQPRVVAVGDLGERGDVGDTEVGVRDDLGVDESGVGAYGGAHGFQVGDVDEVDIDAELGRQQRLEKPPGAHVDDVGDDRMVTGVEDREERGVQGGHPSAKRLRPRRRGRSRPT